MRAHLSALTSWASLGVALAAQIPFTAPPATPNQPLKKGLITGEVHEYISGLIDRWNSTGLSVAVIKDGEVEFGSYGIANVNGDPVTPDTLYGIASNSKLFLSLSVGLVLEERNLTWKTKAREIFAGTGLWGDEMDAGIAVQDMLSHRTGYPRHDASGAPFEGGVAEMVGPAIL
jgi:CubicO group peptidase (beta-lactamase class C family)